MNSENKIGSTGIGLSAASLNGPSSTDVQSEIPRELSRLNAAVEQAHIAFEQLAGKLQTVYVSRPEAPSGHGGATPVSPVSSAVGKTIREQADKLLALVQNVREFSRGIEL